MFFYLLFSIAQGKEKICICNGECHSFCSHKVFDASSDNSKFQDYFITQFQKTNEIEIDFYSKQKDFVFTINPSLFQDKKITFKTLKYSSSITLKIKQAFQLFPKKIEIMPDYEMIYPNLIPFKSERKHKINNILPKTIPEPLPSSISIPMSVSIAQMNPTGSDTKCAFLPGHSDNYNDQPFNSTKSSQEYYCDYNQLNQETAYNCGWRCYGNFSGYSYTFRGVKFALYGTFDPNHGTFSVELDGEIIKVVDQSNPERKPYSLLYASEILEYKDHVVKIVSNQQIYEFYKLAYWPSMTAKRVNSSSFALDGDWTKESDGIGGLRHYHSQNFPSTTSISLNCSKFWLYGVRFSHLGEFTMNYNGTTETINQGGSRDEGVLLYESPELENTSITINFNAPGVLMIYCIYYEEVSVPISVGLKEMSFSDGIECGFYYQSNTSIVTLNKTLNTQALGCEYNNLNSQSAYTCGLKCWTSSGVYTYTFKGVKFAVYGTYNTGHGAIKIELDGVEQKIVYQNVRNQPYAQLYKSGLFEYKEHTIRISHYSGNAYELYKIAYWPSITAKRLNATDIVNKNGEWTKESDGIGGNRIYCNSKGGSLAITLRCSKFWIYGLKDFNYKDIKISHNGIVTNLVQNNTERIESALLYESPEISASKTIITLLSRNVFMLDYIFYEEIVGPVETPVPLSVGLQQMTKEGTIENCGTNKKGSDVSYDVNIDETICSISNLESPDTYNCGLRCWGTSLSFSYTFTGVKFAFYGTYENTFDTVYIDLDGKKIAEINVNFSRLSYELIYESEVINYKQHSVKIYSNGLYEIYKLVFWPSMKAKRINSTSFTKYESEYKDLSDGVGGIKEVKNTQSSAGFNIPSISYTKFWFYAYNHQQYGGGVTLTYNHGQKQRCDIRI